MEPFKAFYDRREEKTAVLLVGPGNQEVLWPADCLPKGVKPGQYLKFVISPDPDATRDAQKRVSDLIRQLSETNLSEHD